MKTLLSILFALTLMSCNMPSGMGRTVVPRDWSKFVVPAPGTPCALTVYYFTGLRSFQVINFPGTWGDGKPYRLSFPIWTTVKKVGRIEVVFQGKVIIAKNFNPPIQLTKGTLAGWENV